MSLTVRPSLFTPIVGETSLLVSLIEGPLRFGQVEARIVNGDTIKLAASPISMGRKVLNVALLFLVLVPIICLIAHAILTRCLHNYTTAPPAAPPTSPDAVQNPPDWEALKASYLWTIYENNLGYINESEEDLAKRSISLPDMLQIDKYPIVEKICYSEYEQRIHALEERAPKLAAFVTKVHSIDVKRKEEFRTRVLTWAFPVRTAYDKDYKDVPLVSLTEIDFLGFIVNHPAVDPISIRKYLIPNIRIIQADCPPFAAFLKKLVTVLTTYKEDNIFHRIRNAPNMDPLELYNHLFPAFATLPKEKQREHLMIWECHADKEFSPFFRAVRVAYQATQPATTPPPPPLRIPIEPTVVNAAPPIAASTTSPDVVREEEFRARVLKWTSAIRTAYEDDYENVSLESLTEIDFLGFASKRVGGALPWIGAHFIPNIKIIRDDSPRFAAFLEKLHTVVTTYKEEIFRRIRERDLSIRPLDFYKTLFPAFATLSKVKQKEHLSIWQWHADNHADNHVDHFFNAVSNDYLLETDPSIPPSPPFIPIQPLISKGAPPIAAPSIATSTIAALDQIKREKAKNWAETGPLRVGYEQHYKNIPLENFQPIQFLNMNFAPMFGLGLWKSYMEYIETIRGVDANFAAFMIKFHFTLTAYRDDIFAKIQNRDPSENPLAFYRTLFSDFDNQPKLSPNDSSIITQEEHINLWQSHATADNNEFFDAVHEEWKKEEKASRRREPVRTDGNGAQPL